MHRFRAALASFPACLGTALVLTALTPQPPLTAQEVGPPVSATPPAAPVEVRESAFADAVPGLPRASSWALQGDAPAPAAWPVGNGRIFAALGLGAPGEGAPANRLDRIVGPRYGSPGGGGSLGLRLAGDDRGALDARTHRLTGTGFVETEELVDGVALRTLTFAPLDPRHGALLLRLVELEELAGRARPGLHLELTGTDATGRVAGLPADRHAVRLGSRAATRMPCALSAGGKFRTTLTLSVWEPGGSAAPDLDWNAVCERARSDLAAWRERLRDATTLDTDHIRFQDLCRDHVVHTLVMTCAETGVVVPMLGDRVASVREQIGATLTLLRFGLHDEARRALEWFRSAAERTGEVRAEYPLDLAPGTSPVAWQDIALRPTAEIPSWLLLQFFWYWRATRDAGFVAEHWPLIEVCLKRQTRGKDSLMPFSGSEPWLHGLAPFADPERTALVGDAPAQGRTSRSFVSSVLFLMAVQAVGDMVDGLDRHRNPENYASGEPPKRPGEAYTRRSFALLEDLERRYWLADQGLFAPAISPVDDRPHRLPLAGANLMPLWVGWTFPTGEKSRDNLRNTCERLADGRGGLWPSPRDRVRPGDQDAMLLVALSERDGVARNTVFDRILDSATASGGFARWLDPESRPLGDDLLSPGISGVVVDALLFACTGVRYAAVPNWDDDDIRLELRVPNGGSFVTVRGIRKDGRRLDLFFRKTLAPMDEEELRANEQLPEDQRRDPDQPQPRTNFVVDLIDGSPERGYYDVAINAEGTVFVRYLKPDAPATADEPDLRRIEEQVFVTPDKETFLPVDTAAEEPPSRPRPVELPEGIRTAVLTLRGADLFDTDAVFRFDTGRPFSLQDLRRLLLDDRGDRRIDRLLLDWHHDAGLPSSPVPPSRFAGSAWRTLRERFVAAGGSVRTLSFAGRATAETTGGQEVTVTGEQGLEVPAGIRSLTCVLPPGMVGAPGDAVLRVGTPFAYRMAWNGENVLRGRGGNRSLPDLDAALVRVGETGNATVRIDFAEPTPRAERLFLRLSDAAGLPRE